MKTLRHISCLVSLVTALSWTGCTSGDPPDKQNADDPSANDTADHLFDPLMKGDQVQIDLRGVPIQIPPSVQNIQQDGTISLENIGAVKAAGLTPKQLEDVIHDQYVPSIYRRLTVNVTPLRRYFYVSGQVHNSTGGRVAYTSAITVTQAIAAAGDFNDYGDQRHVRLTRMRDGKQIIVDCKKILKHKAVDPQVAPGDQIYVPRRVF